MISNDFIAIFFAFPVTQSLQTKLQYFMTASYTGEYRHIVNNF